MRRRLKSIWKFITAPFRWVAKSYRGVRNFFTQEPEDTPLPEIVGKTVRDVDGLFFHVNELRKHLFNALVFLILTTVVSFVFITPIIDFLSLPIGGIDQLQAIDVTEPISVLMKVALLSGFALAFPYIAFQLWLFAAPGLSIRARVWGLVGIPVVTIFFMGGILIKSRLI